MGNTFSMLSRQKPIEDHPHIHGEYQWLGKTLRVNQRITPIYMGNTVCFFLNINHKQDHPHIHGEYTAALDGIRPN